MTYTFKNSLLAVAALLVIAASPANAGDEPKTTPTIEKAKEQSVKTAGKKAASETVAKAVKTGAKTAAKRVTGVVGDLLFPTKLGDGTLAGAAKQEADKKAAEERYSAKMKEREEFFKQQEEAVQKAAEKARAEAEKAKKAAAAKAKAKAKASRSRSGDDGVHFDGSRAGSERATREAMDTDYCRKC